MRRISSILKNVPQAPFLVLLFFGFVFPGCGTPRAFVGEFSIQGAVTHIHGLYNRSKTEFDILIDKNFNGKLPDDIDSITVDGPDGRLPVAKDDFRYYPQFRSFTVKIPGAPSIGAYNFTVTSGGSTASAADEQTRLLKIPIPDAEAFTPATGEIITCKSPVFSWDPVAAEIPVIYRIEINDMKNKRVFASRYISGMDSIRTPPGLFEAGGLYRWRVRAVDGFNLIEMNNRSNSEWRRFIVDQNQGDCEYTYRIPIDAGDGWKTSTLDAENVDPGKIRELMRLILNDDMKNIHSLLVIKNGRLILEEYFSGFHRNRKHVLRSATKSVTSILFGIARDQGEKIVVEEKLFNYLPEYKRLASNNDKNQITLKHLLTMKAGLEWNEFHAPSDIQLMLESNDSVKYVLERKLVDPPGETFFYSSGVSTVLGKVFENTTGSDVYQFGDKHLFSPLGITDYYWRKLPDGSASTGWGLHLRPRDFAKLGYLFLKDGAWKGAQIVSKEWVEESIYPHASGDLVSGTGYGYQWWSGSTRIGDHTIDCFYAAGHGGQVVFVVPSLDLITVVTSQSGNNNAGDFRAYSIMENYILPAVLQTDPAIETPPFNIDDHRHITGKYKWRKAKLNLKIFIENGALRGYTFLFDNTFDLFPVKDKRYLGVSKDIGKFWLDVIEDSKGKIKGVKLIIGFSNLTFGKTRELFFGI